MARLIDAERLLKELQTKFDRAERDAEFTGNREIRIGWDDAICAIKQADTVDAEPVRHGRWIMKSDPYGFFDEIPVCSECGCTTKMREKTKFCPNCGAKMDLEKENADSKSEQ